MKKLTPAQKREIKFLHEHGYELNNLRLPYNRAVVFSNLEKMGLVADELRSFPTAQLMAWELTDAGRELAESLFGSDEPDPQPPAGETQPRKVRNVKDDSGKTVIRTNTDDTARIAEMLVHQQATEKIRDRIRHRTTRVKVTRDYPLPTGAALHGRGTQKATSKPIAARKAKQAGN